TILGCHAADLAGGPLSGEPAAIAAAATMRAAAREGSAVVDGAGEAKWLLVALDEADTSFALLDTHGFEADMVPGADPTRRAARVSFDQGALAGAPRIEVPAGFVQGLMTLVAAAESVGVASWCVEVGADWARVREQFDRPIGQFQAVKHRCADALCRLEMARAALFDAASLELDDPQFPLAVAAAGALAPVAAFDCAKDAIQVLGGIGYTWDHDAHLYLRRATLLSHTAAQPSHWRAAIVQRAVDGDRRNLSIELPASAENLRSRIRTEVAEVADLPKSEWNTALADGGWLAPHWPKPWGRGAAALEQLVIDEELAARGVKRRHLQVAGWVLPTLIAHGTPHQQQRYVAPSLRAELTWCQLFSEPGAGSDLASLSTRATRADGGWLLNGQKVWTTMAREADFGLCLARTDPEAPKHDGITAFVIDMGSDGLDIRPLRELTGFAMFNEVFFDNVFVPDEMVVGAVNEGWRAARTTLENERVSMASGSSFGPGVLSLLELADRRDMLQDPLVVDLLGSLLVDSQALAMLGLRSTLRAIDDTARTGPEAGRTGPEASVRKLVAVEHEQRIQEAALQLLGPDAVVDEGEGQLWFAGFLGNRALSIAGGTSEIQRNVIGERLLGLPRD
ncbi:MAG: acyl-CoA dehydrogenase family protein, partial [Microthrixaceae bacterium]